MNDKWIIYLHKNKINGKVYIGQTKEKNPERRWGKGNRYCGYFKKAIEKYGWDNFEHIILEDNIFSQEKANELEKYYISKYNSNDSSFGYNLTSGGGQNFQINKEYKKQRSKISKDRWKSEKFRENMRQKMRECWQNEEYREKMVNKIHKYWEEHPEERIKKGQKIKCIETGEIFNTYKEAGKWCGLINAKSSFINYFNGLKYSCGKHPITKISLHWIKIDKNGNEIINNQNFDAEKSKTKFTKKVQCIETGEIFNSIKEASLWCGLSKNGSGISNMLSGRKKSAGKHPETGAPLHWKRIEGDN